MEKNSSKYKSAGELFWSLLDDLEEEARGSLSIPECQLCKALLLCFAKGKKFIDGEYVPDPTDEFCFFYDQIWGAMQVVWGKFRKACGKLYLPSIAKIQEMAGVVDKYAFDRCFVDVRKLGGNYLIQPYHATKLALSQLDYCEGDVYNPFAGTASFGDNLLIRDQYYGEESDFVLWILGAIRLLLGGTPSHNYIKGDSIHFPDRKFKYVISTPPFGAKLQEDGSMPADEYILSKADSLLEHNGTMVTYVISSMLTRGGRAEKVRKCITDAHLLDTVILLPREFFHPYTLASTALIVLRKGRGDMPIRFVDARDCTRNGSVNTEEIIARLDDDNFTCMVSTKQIQGEGYFWHPGRYSEASGDSRDVERTRIRLKELLHETGVSMNVYDSLEPVSVRYASVSSLSSDPFDFKRETEDFEMKTFVSSDFLQVAATRNLIDEQIAAMKASRDEIKKEIENAEHSGWIQIREEEERMQASIKRKEFERMSIISKLEGIDSKEHEAQKRYEALAASGRDESPLSALYAMKETIAALAAQKAELEEQLHLITKAMASEKDQAEYLGATTRQKVMRDTERLFQRQRDIEDRIMQLESRAAMIDREHGAQGHSSNVMTKVSSPSLILGDNFPKLQYAFVEASSAAPIFMPKNRCFAFEVDQSKVDIAFLVYQISAIDFSIIGSRSSRTISKEDILNALIPVFSSLNAQREFIRERELEANPYRKELEELKKNYEQSESRLLAALGSKQHDLGNLCPKITLKFADLSDMIDELPDDIITKELILRQIDIISEEMKDMNKIIRIISEREDFPKGEKVNLVDFFSRYIDTHPGSDYRMDFNYDIAVYEEMDGEIAAYTSDIALTRALLNIRENAEMHGFDLDDQNKEHIFTISLSADTDKGICIIDFSNNGKPMPQGMDNIRYGTRGEYAGDNGHTGNGGWYVTEMAKFYGGHCDVNPKDADEKLTTIRITLPISHD